MEEIALLIDGLKKRAQEKKDELPTDAIYEWGKLEIIIREIASFEAAYNARERNPAHRNEILANFRKGAIDLAEQLAKIKA